MRAPPPPAPAPMSTEWFRRRFLHRAPSGAAGWRAGLEDAVGSPEPPASPLPYRRPKFLRVVAPAPRPHPYPDPQSRPRPVYSPAPDRPLPWNAGYAEVINAEKSEFNEDQAACGHLSIKHRELGDNEDQEWMILCQEEYITGCYWALFDGHGGPTAAVMASNVLHSCLRAKLEDIVEGILAPQPPMHLSGCRICPSDPLFVEEKGIQAQDLVIGAIEKAFQECDAVIGQKMTATGQAGGCTALAVLYLEGKLYVANAGDSRAILVQRKGLRALSSEFTPETERQRIQHLAFTHPRLLANEFTRLEFPRRLRSEDLGQKVLFRDYNMNGWGYKQVEKSDLKYPLVHGQGKQARLLGTLAVSRGLGDHHLKVLDSDIHIKPFLLSIPEVTVIDLEQQKPEEEDVIIMATDGLWDVLANEQVAQLTHTFLQNNRHDPNRFSELAKLLIHTTQGREEGTWQQSSAGDVLVSYDDVSVFVIPLYHKKTKK
ncbi:protein phosphatase 1M [Sarcophilus harrisii]|uniref:Protein phosphatase, Mg2+/Mn2+ dependent 1M n=1 Tax=Sarcophilus harrisii TaxID=9305 RepID=A0A7N4PES1_SARHA|nr:protein phosphatase 1M [Sarcophilus harrisii]